MTLYFPDEKEEEDATFIVSSFNILHAIGLKMRRVQSILAELTVGIEGHRQG